MSNSQLTGHNVLQSNISSLTLLGGGGGMFSIGVKLGRYAAGSNNTRVMGF
jgi:hypothetical protein